MILNKVKMHIINRCSFCLTTLILVVVLIVDIGYAQTKMSKPNVIILFTDDQGTLDMNIYGSDDLHTPHMDALAENGVRFTQFYAAAAICTPSRVGLLTGRFPFRAGLAHNSESHPTQFGQGPSLSSDEVTIADMLKAHGYRTAQIGKWHLGTNPGPNGQGFDYSFGFLGGVVDQWSHFNYGRGSWGTPPRWHDLHRNGEEIWEAGNHIGDLIVRESIDIMEEDSDKPFFLYLAFGLPHFPLQPYNHYMDYYKDLEEPRRSYAAAVSTTDDQIGEIISKVDELGIRENTLIIFQSDHGHATTRAANYGGGNAGPYRGAKHSYFEGGIRVPAIISMPGTLPEGVVRDQLSHGVDWLPTIAEIAETNLLHKEIDGKSLIEIIHDQGADTPHDVLHWYDGSGDDGQWAVRQGPWKLIGNPKDSSERWPSESDALKEEDRFLFLSNLEKDKTEITNYATQYPEVLERLHNLHINWKRKIEEVSEIIE